MAQTNETPKPTTRQPRSLFGPLLLILVGVIFLLSNTGALQGDTWQNLLNWWPALLILAGLDGVLRRDGLVASALITGVGVVFLLSNLGFLNVDIWRLVLNLWPLLLVAWGLDVMIGRRSLIAALLALVVMLAILAGALWAFGAFTQPGLALTSEQVSQPLGQATSGRVIIEPAVGKMMIGAQEGSNVLVQGTVGSRRGQKTLQDFSQQGDQAVYRLRSQNTVAVFGSVDSSFTWDLKLAAGVPIDLKFSLGVGEATLDLKNLNLSRLDVSLGVGQLNLTLPATGSFEAKVNQAIGSMNIVVPEGMAVRIKTGLALVGKSFPDSYQKNGDVYTSPGFDSATNRIELDLSQAIGSVDVR